MAPPGRLQLINGNERLLWAVEAFLIYMCVCVAFVLYVAVAALRDRKRREKKHIAASISYVFATTAMSGLIFYLFDRRTHTLNVLPTLSFIYEFLALFANVVVVVVSVFKKPINETESELVCCLCYLLKFQFVAQWRRTQRRRSK